MIRKLISLFTLSLSSVALAQVGIGTVEPAMSAQLEIAATNRGVLLPRIELKDKNDKNTIVGELIESLLVYHIGNNTLDAGFYYWYSNSWVRLTDGNKFTDRKNNTFTIGTNPSKNNEESLVITDTENHSVYLAVTKIANNETFIQNLVENNNFITQLGDNLDFVTQITNKEEFITNIVNALEGHYGNVGYDKEKDLFYYYDEKGNKHDIDWSDLDTKNASFTMGKSDDGVESLVITDSQGGKVYLAVTEIANNETFIQNLVENNNFITQLGDNLDFVTQITNKEEFITNIVNALEGHYGNVGYDKEKDLFYYYDEKGNKHDIDINNLFNETITTLENKGKGVYEYKNEENTITAINIIKDVQENYEEIVNSETVREILDHIIKEGATITMSKEGEDVVIDSDELTVNLTTEIRNKESLTSLKHIREEDAGVAKDYLLYKPERGEEEKIDISSLIQSNETLTSLLNKEVNGKVVPAVYIYSDENQNKWEIDIPAALSESEEFNEFISNLINNIPSSIVHYSSEEQIKPEKWMNTNKQIALRVFDVTLNKETNLIQVPGDFAETIIHARLIHKETNSITEGVIRKEFINGSTQVIVGTPNLMTVYHPVGDYFMILEYIKK